MALGTILKDSSCFLFALSHLVICDEFSRNCRKVAFDYGFELPLKIVMALSVACASNFKNVKYLLHIALQPRLKRVKLAELDAT